MTAGALDVLIAGKLAGTLSQDGAGSLSFAYERGYRGVPLSSSMPLSTRPYRDKVVLPYLWGLLPEDPAATTRNSLLTDCMQASMPLTWLSITAAP